MVLLNASWPSKTEKKIMVLPKMKRVWLEDAYSVQSGHKGSLWKGIENDSCTRRCISD